LTTTAVTLSPDGPGTRKAPRRSAIGLREGACASRAPRTDAWTVEEVVASIDPKIATRLLLLAIREDLPRPKPKHSRPYSMGATIYRYLPKGTKSE
jgi:hypothetical protein